MEQTEQKKFSSEFIVSKSRFLSPWNDDAVLEFEFTTDNVEGAMRLANEQAALHRYDSDHYLICVIVEAKWEDGSSWSGYFHRDGEARKEILNWAK